MRILPAVLAAPVVALAALPALAQPMHPYGYGHMGFGSLVFWVVIIGLVVWAVRHRRLPWFEGRNNAMTILRERYARGEVNAEEFAERKKHLSDDGR